MTDDKSVKPWRWPGQWVRQESFWREVGTRTLAAIFAAGFIFIFALAAGYVGRPDVSRVIILAGAIALNTSFLFFTSTSVGAWLSLKNEGKTPSLRALLRTPSPFRRALIGIIIIALIVCIAIAVVVTRG